MECHLWVLASNNLKLFLHIGRDAQRAEVQTRYIRISLHFVVSPVVEGASQEVRTAKVWHLLVFLPVAHNSIRIQFHLKDIVESRIFVRTPHLPVLPVITNDGHLLWRSILHLANEEAVKILVCSNSSGSHLVHPPYRCTRIGTTKAEGQDTVEAGLCLEGNILSGHDAREARHVQVRIQTVQVAIRSSFSVHAQKDTFQESRHTSASFTVSNVGLGGCDHHWLMPGHRGHHLLVGANFNGITQGGTGAMAFRGIHLWRLHTHLFDHCLQTSLLGRPIWSGQRCTSSILIDLTSGHHAIVPLLPFEGLELERTRRRCLTASVAIS
mmetsp:Transcript_93350/g.114346  ORF Transcript_93350/g.114346 Transcript_93350/m.114346 type:complete len:325 (-) Transcript_93350:378-1352(-)